MAESTFRQPLPIPNEDSSEYWDGTRKNKLLLQHCDQCGKYRFPPQHLCPDCWSDRSEWVEAAGKGEVYTFAVARRAIKPDWNEKIPYVTALVQLDEGPKIFTNIVECAPEDVTIGMRVKVIFDHVNEEIALPKFVPLDV